MCFKLNRLFINCFLFLLICISFVYIISILYVFICNDFLEYYYIFSFLYGFDWLKGKESFFFSDNIILRICFFVNISSDLPWVYYIDLQNSFCNISEPLLRVIRITNESNNSITAIALVDIFPSEFKGFFNKQQCFCFEPIRLYPWETVYLPIIFNILPEICFDFHFGDSNFVVILYSFIRVGW